MSICLHVNRKFCFTIFALVFSLSFYFSNRSFYSMLQISSGMMFGFTRLSYKCRITLSRMILLSSSSGSNIPRIIFICFMSSWSNFFELICYSFLASSTCHLCWLVANLYSRSFISRVWSSWRVMICLRPSCWEPSTIFCLTG